MTPEKLDEWTFEPLTGDGWAIIGPDDEERHSDWSADGYGRAIALDREDAERIVAALNAARREAALREALEPDRRLARAIATALAEPLDGVALKLMGGADLVLATRVLRALLSEVPQSQPTPKRKRYSYHPPYDEGDAEVPQ